MKRKLRMIRNRLIIYSLLLALLMNLYPASTVYADINGYPDEAQSSIDNGWYLAGSARYWEGLVALKAGKPYTHGTYTIRRNSATGNYVSISRNDFMYEANWYASINGSRVYKMLMLMRPLGEVEGGRTFVPNNDINWWATELNGEPSYVNRQATGNKSFITGNNSWEEANRIYSADLAEYAGAYISGIKGLGIYSVANTQLSEVQFVTTKFPDARISGPTTGKPYVNVPLRLSGQEFYPTHFYNKRQDQISYSLSVNGSVVKTEQKQNTKVYNDTYNLNKPPGTYQIKLEIWDQVERKKTVTHTVVISEEEAPPTPPPSTGCDIQIIEEGISGSSNMAKESASPVGSISSQTGAFDVVKGIPSSESLRTDVTTEEYLFHQRFDNQRGRVRYNVPVQKTFNLKWTETETVTNEDGEEEEIKTEMTDVQIVEDAVSVERPYSYWDIGRLDIWKLDNAIFRNYALPNGQSTSDYYQSIQHSESHSENVRNHVFPVDCNSIVLPSQTLDGGNTKPTVPSIKSEGQSKAESSIKPPNVKNDHVVFKNQTIMDNRLVSQYGPSPSNIPQPPRIHLEKSNQLIDRNKTNYYQSPSSGTTNYSSIANVNGFGGSKQFDFSVNPVTVHTPVVTFARESDSKGMDQRSNPPRRSYETFDGYASANPNVDRHAFILDEEFHISIPTNGQHRNIPGYGNKDYAKYIDSKYVKFEFDVFAATANGTANINEYYPKGTWIKVPVNQLTADFFLPVWVPEGEYTTEFKTIGINAPNKNPSAPDATNGIENEANITIPNRGYNIGPGGNQTAAHTTIDRIGTDVVGRLYDFHVTDVEDYNWQSIFRQKEGLSPHTGNTFWVGDKDLNGKLRTDNDKQTSKLLTLPIGPGSHLKYDNIVPKTGYTFKFDLKTKGEFFSKNDGIKLDPSFYYVSADGTKRTEVDLYYNSDSKNYVKIGSADDNTMRSVIWNESMRNIHNDQFISNSIVYFTNADDYGFNISSINDVTFMNLYKNRYTSTEKVNTGPYAWQILNWKLRGFIGPIPTGNDIDDMMVKKAYNSNFENGITTYQDLVPPLYQGYENPGLLSQIYSVQDIVVATEQQWYGEYSIPANAKPVPKGFDLANYGRINKLSDSWVHSDFGAGDGYIVVNFDIQTMRARSETDPWNLEYVNPFYAEANQWKKEGFAPSFQDKSGNRFTNKDGDVMYYDADESSHDDHKSSVTH